MSTSGFGIGGYGTSGYGGAGVDVFRAPARTQIPPKPATSHLELVAANLLVTTLAAVAAPFVTSLFPNPVFAAQPHFIHAQQPNRLPALLAQPFKQIDWPNPSSAAPSVELRTHIQTRKTYYVDTFFGLAGNPTFDWPNPRGAQRGVSLIDEQSSGLALTVAPVATPNQWLNYDWPNPRGYQRASTLDAFAPTLLPITAKPFLQTDYPNPRGYARASTLDAFAPTRLPATAKPFLQTDYQNPRGYQRAVDLATNISSGLALTNVPPAYPAQNKSYDWPNPRGAAFPSELRGYIQQATVRFIGKDTFFGLAGHPTFDWPNPRGPIPAIALRSHVVNLQQTPFTVPPSRPFDNKNYDWPVPKGPVFPIVLRGMANAHMPMVGWTTLDPAAGAGWGPVSGVNSPGWGPVSDSNSVTWTLVNASNDSPTGFK